MMQDHYCHLCNERVAVTNERLEKAEVVQRERDELRAKLKKAEIEREQNLDTARRLYELLAKLERMTNDRDNERAGREKWKKQAGALALQLGRDAQASLRLREVETKLEKAEVVLDLFAKHDYWVVTDHGFEWAPPALPCEDPWQLASDALVAIRGSEPDATGCYHDRVHKEPGNARPAATVRNSRKVEPAAIRGGFWADVERRSDQQRQVPDELRELSGVPKQPFDVDQLPTRREGTCTPATERQCVAMNDDRENFFRGGVTMPKSNTVSRLQRERDELRARLERAEAAWLQLACGISEHREVAWGCDEVGETADAYLYDLLAEIGSGPAQHADNADPNTGRDTRDLEGRK